MSYHRNSIGEFCREGLVQLQTGPFGSQLHAHDYVEAGVSVVPTEAIRDRRIDRSLLPKISAETAERLSRHRLAVGDILFARRGAQATGHIAFVHQGDADGICGTGAIRLRVASRQSKLDPAFLSHYLACSEARAWIRSQAIGATMPNLNEGIIKRLEVPLPAFDLQVKIASVLDRLETKIELNRRMNETLEAMARAVFRDWFVDFGPTRRKIEGAADPVEIMGGLVPDADEAGKLARAFTGSMSEQGLPDGWKLSSVGEFVDILDARRVPLSARQREQRKGPFPYHGATGVMDYVADFLFDEILLLVGEDGSVVKPNGRPYTQYVWGRIWVNNHAHVLRGKKVSTEQMKVFFDQTDVAPFVTGAVQPKLSQGNLKSIPFLRATDQVHFAFDEIVRPMFALMRLRTDESRTLASVRDLLLPKLMSGEIRLLSAEAVAEAAE